MMNARLDKKNCSPGETWVKNPDVLGGGYCRINKKSDQGRMKLGRAVFNTALIGGSFLAGSLIDREIMRRANEMAEKAREEEKKKTQNSDRIDSFKYSRRPLSLSQIDKYFHECIRNRNG